MRTGFLRRLTIQRVEIRPLKNPWPFMLVTIARLHPPHLGAVNRTLSLKKVLSEGERLP